MNAPPSSDLPALIERFGLSAVAATIRERAAPCYSVSVAGADDYAEVGNTRFGGEPDLPPGFAWPCDGDDPEDPDSRFSNFVAQINFAELPPLPGGANRSLPDRGVLSVFVREMDGAAWPVLLDAHYFDGDIAALRRTAPPDGERMADEYLVELKLQRVRFTPTFSLPLFDKRFRAVLDEAGEWFDFVSALRGEGAMGQVLGYANAGDIRENLYRQVHLARVGKRELTYSDYWDSVAEYEAYIEPYRDSGRTADYYEKMRPGVEWLAANRESVAAGAAEWQLLLQIDSNRAMEFWINDADPLYVFVRDADLAARRFSDLAGEVTQG